MGEVEQAALWRELAHELRSPLNAARLQLEVLARRAERLTEPDVTPYLTGPVAIVQGEIRRLSGLLDEFLALAQPGDLQCVHVSIAELFDEVVRLLRPAAEAAEIELRVAVHPDLRVWADPDRLKQVMLNLTTNAIEALRGRGRGRLELSAAGGDDGRICIAVTDDGPGVPEPLRSCVFHPSITTKTQGAGLGLAIVKSLVERHGGEVRMLPRPLGGSRAEVLLPTRDPITPVD